MSIAVITGASSGMGREFVRQLDRFGFSQMWVIARRRERLEELRAEVRTPLRILELDLTDGESMEQYRATLERERPQIGVLVNCAGFGKFGKAEEIPLPESLGMIDLNCKALVAMTELSLPYLLRGGKVIQLDSLSAFQPVPGIATYGATKAFVLSYSRALNRELRPREIRVTAVCPGWVKTEFFDRAMETDDATIRYFNRLYEAKDVVATALRDVRHGKDVSVHGLPIRAQVLGVKLLPHSWVMDIWMRQQGMK